MYSYGGSGKSQLIDKCIRKTFLAVRGCFAQPFISKSLIFVLLPFYSISYFPFFDYLQKLFMAQFNQENKRKLYKAVYDNIF